MAQQCEEEHVKVVWIKFKDEFECDDLSAELLSAMFSSFGDFHLHKDTKKSCIINFYYFEEFFVPDKSPQGFIEVMKKEENLEKYHILEIC